MKILAIDTSGKQAAAAIMDNYITIGEIMINAQSGPKTFHHSQILMPAIERMFALSGLEIAQMDYVAYTSGPGSFTGIRIGASTALGLARGINRPAIPVPTLDALAYNILCAKEGGLVVPLLDARKGQVYAAVYRQESGGLVKQTDYFADAIEAVIDQVKSFGEDVTYLGDGACANRPAIEALHPKAAFVPPNANRQRAASVALCALHQIEAGHKAENIELIYVRDPEAVRNLAAKQKP